MMWAMPEYRIGLTTLVLVVACGSPGITDDAERADRQSDSSPILNEMRGLMQRTQVSVFNGDAEATIAELLDQPLMHYVQDDRRIEHSTLWVWTHQQRPVAMQKLEVNGQTGGNWTYCFASLSSDRIKVDWPNASEFAAEQGVEYYAIADAPKPRSSNTLRSQQLRALARRFTAHADQGPQRKFLHDLRLLPRPLFEYEARDAGVTQGAVFGFATGTNPDALVVIELREAEGRAAEWFYAPIRMTSSGVVMNLDDEPVFSREGKWPQQRFSTWMYAFVRRTRQ